MIREEIVYKRWTFVCDNCGREETIIRSSEDPRYNEIPPMRQWVNLPIRSFARLEEHACGRACAEAIAKRAIADAMPSWRAVAEAAPDRATF